MGQVNSHSWLSASAPRGARSDADVGVSHAAVTRNNPKAVCFKRVGVLAGRVSVKAAIAELLKEGEGRYWSTTATCKPSARSRS